MKLTISCPHSGSIYVPRPTRIGQNLFRKAHSHFLRRVQHFQRMEVALEDPQPPNQVKALRRKLSSKFQTWRCDLYKIHGMMVLMRSGNKGHFLNNKVVRFGRSPSNLGCKTSAERNWTQLNHINYIYNFT